MTVRLLWPRRLRGRDGLRHQPHARGLSRFEERIRREEALARGMEEVAASSLDEQFAQLDMDEDEIEVETRFSQLKAGKVARLTDGD